MPGGYSPPTRTDGTTLTAAIYNADHAVHQTNMTAAVVDDHSVNVAQMQTQTDPGEVGSESLATSVAGELERIRFILAEMKGQTYWYETGQDSITIAGSAGKLGIRDTAGTWGTAVPEIELQDSAATVGGQVRFDTSQNLIIENLRTAATIQLTTTGTGAVHVNGGDLRIQDQSPALIMEDTDAATDTAVIGRLIGLRTGGSDLFRIGLNSATDDHVEISNLISGGNIELNPTGAGIVDINAAVDISGDVTLSEATPAIVFSDTDAATDTQITGTITFGRPATPSAAFIGYNTTLDAILRVSNSLGPVLLTTGTGDVQLTTSSKVQVSKRLDVGTPTSPQDGTGFINASSVFDDGVLLTGYVLDYARQGHIDLTEWDRLNNGYHQPAHDFVACADTYLSLERYIAAWQTTGELPNMPSRNAWSEKPLSLGVMVQKHWESLELHAVHIASLHDRVQQLERKHGSTTD